MTNLGHQATGAQMRILAGVYDEITRRMFERHRHTGSCPGCPECDRRVEREQQARPAYQRELDQVFG